MKNIQKYFMSKNGITLISLIVTILVMLILASVAIFMSIGENGVIDRAKGADEKTRAARVKEEYDIWESGKKTSKYSNSNASQKYYEFLEELEREGLITEEEKNAIISTGEVTIGNKTIKFRDPIIAKVGDYVNYEYQKKGDYEVDGHNLIYNSESLNYTEVKIKQIENLKWKVLDIDERENTALIIAVTDENISKPEYRIKLNAKQGIVNGVFVINDVCENLYSVDNENYNLKARSINIEDINKVVPEEKFYSSMQEIDMSGKNINALEMIANRKYSDPIYKQIQTNYNEVELADEIQILNIEGQKLYENFEDGVKDILSAFGKNPIYIATRCWKFDNTIPAVRGGLVAWNPNGFAMLNYLYLSSSENRLSSTTDFLIRPIIEVDLEEYSLVNINENMDSGIETNPLEIRRR